MARKLLRFLWGDPPRVFHPLLFALYPGLFLYFRNARETAPAEAAGPLAALFLLGLALPQALRLFFLRDRRTAGIAASALIALFFLFEPLSAALGGVHFSLVGMDVGARRLAGALLCFMSGCFVASVALIRKHAAALTRALNVSGALLLLLSVSGLLIRQSGGPEAASEIAALPVPAITEDTLHRAPDVYYIVLDAYGRADQLEQVVGFDNSPFLDFLKERGFFVAARSRSNYGRTFRSLASSLNQQYLHTPFAGGAGARWLSNYPDLIRNNEVMRVFGEMGYKRIAFSTGYGWTELRNTDLYLDGPGLGAFSNALLALTPLPALNRIAGGGLVPKAIQYEQHRARISYVFENLPRIAADPAPTFTFAHVLCPHPPYVFGPEGELLLDERPFVLSDNSFWMMSERKTYAGQLAHLNRLLEQAVSRILAVSPREPIIILQGDHGTAFELLKSGPEGGTLEKPPEYATDAAFEERYGILNAYYFPGGADILYPEISPVNSFRAILNRYFGTQLELLPDDSFYQMGQSPIQDLTPRLR